MEQEPIVCLRVSVGFGCEGKINVGFAPGSPKCGLDIFWGQRASRDGNQWSTNGRTPDLLVGGTLWARVDFAGHQ